MPLEPRCLCREDAASYAGCRTLAAFHDRIRRGILPGPIPGTHTWDRKAIDAYLDAGSKITPTEAISPLEQWRASRARKPQRPL